MTPTDTADTDPAPDLAPGHPLLERGPLAATWRRWVLPDGRVRWTWRVTWGADSCEVGDHGRVG